MQRTSELAKITELTISSGIKLVKVSTKVTEEALVAAFYKDAQTVDNCKPYGKPDFSLLPKELKPTLALAHSEKPASADMSIVEQGVSGFSQARTVLSCFDNTTVARLLYRL